MRGYAIGVVFVVVACGSSSPPFVGGDDIAAPFDGGDATVRNEAGSDVTVPPPDAPDDTTPFVGGPFLCDQCICDGTKDMCFHSGGGAQPAPMDDDGGFGDAGICPADGGPQSCQAIPINCLLDPTCECILQTHPPPACTCSVDPSGDGFRVDCNYP